MAYKIAFASSDGENINQKFHDSHNFIIYEVSDTLKWKQLEIRNCKESNEKKEAYEKKKTQTCGDGLGCGCGVFNSAKIPLIEDCRSLVCTQIGLKAQKELIKRDITPIEVSLDIKTALNKLVLYFHRVDNHEHLFELKHKN